MAVNTNGENKHPGTVTRKGSENIYRVIRGRRNEGNEHVESLPLTRLPYEVKVSLGNCSPAKEL